MRVTSVIGILIVLVSCMHSAKDKYYKEGDELFEKRFFETGEVQIISRLNADSIKDGLTIHFNESGDTVQVTNYSNGKKDSVETKFYALGRIKSIQRWKNGIAFGDYVRYFDGLEDTYLTELDGDTVEVSEPLISSYDVYNHLGKLRYRREYNESGELIKESGNAILFNKLESTSISIGDTLNVQFYLASPKWVERTFWVNIYDSENIRIDSIEVNVDERLSIAFFNKIFLDAGNFTLEGISHFEDDLIDHIKTDTIRTDISVGDLGV